MPHNPHSTCVVPNERGRKKKKKKKFKSYDLGTPLSIETFIFFYFCAIYLGLVVEQMNIHVH